MYFTMTEEEALCCISLLQSAGNSLLADKIKQQQEYNEDEIARTVVIWRRCDVEDEFVNRFERSPTKDELKDIINNYICGDLEDKGGETAMNLGMNVIYEALEYWESDNMED